MARFEVQGPDGGRYEVEAPDEQSALAVFDKSQASQPAPQTQQSTLADVGKSAGTGLVKGALNVAGFVPDLAWLMRLGFNKAIDAGAGALGINADPYNVGNKPREALGINLDRLGTSDQLKKGVENVAGPFYKPQTTAGKYAQTMGEFLPSAMAFPGGMARNAVVGLASGAGSEASGQLTEGTSAEPYARVAGAFAGGMAPGLLSRAITPLPVRAERQAALATLEREGVPLTAGQRTGSKPLQYLESTLGDMPGAGGRAAQMQVDQSRAFTAAALRKAGESADLATPEVMRGARDRIGSMFDELAQTATVQMDKTFAQNVGDAVSQYVKTTTKGSRPPLPDDIASTLVDFAQNQGGRIAGDQYKSLRSMLTRYKTSDPELNQFIGNVRGAIDDALLRSSGPETAELANAARSQYRNYKTIEKAIGGAGENAAQGMLSPSALRNAVSTGNQRGSYVRGQGDLAELARAGETAMKALPQSGTAPRAWAQGLLAGGGAMTGDASMFLASLLGPAMAGRGLMSAPVQAYLGNQLMPRLQGALPSLAAPEQALLQQLLMARVPATEAVNNSR